MVQEKIKQQLIADGQMSDEEKAPEIIPSKKDSKGKTSEKQAKSPA
jgi:hypothetical protein